MSHTFEVGNKPISKYMINRFTKHPPKPWFEYKEIKLEGKTLYASDVKTIGGPCPLFNAISYAFNNHFPLVLTPDSVWLTILVGLTHHIDTDPEGLRHHFVAHKDKKELKVKILSPGLPNVPKEIWEEGIQKFSEKLQENLNPKKHELIISNFSTTTNTDRLSSQISMMGAMKHYFEYKMMLCCDLTKVTILGTTEDWSDIINRTETLSEFGLSWWVNNLVPVLQQFKKACDGKPDIEFWKRAYIGHGKGSGGQSDVTGWVNAFFPYIAGIGTESMQPNVCVEWENEKHQGVDDDDFPFGLVNAPVVLNDHGVEHDCKFYGGLVGVSITEDFVVKPESGIAIQQLD